MIAVELGRQLKRARTYVSAAILIVIPVILTLAYKFGSRPHKGTHSVVDLASHSGLNLPLISLSVMGPFLLAIVVSAFAGESIAGEATWSSLRYLLVRPVRRGRLLAGKLFVSSALSFAAVVLVVLASLVAGVIAFGWHPVVSAHVSSSSGLALSGVKVVTFSELSALGRIALSMVYVAWSLSSVVAFAFMLSTMTDKAFGAIAGGVGFAVVSQILDAITALGGVRYGLPSHYLQAWNGLFAQPAATADMVRGILVQVPYVLVFSGIAWWWFRRKDIAS